jgi:hypothetical protein
MCLNCGCESPDDEMGNADNLTLTDIAKAAKATGQSAADTLAHVHQSLAKIDAAQLQQRMNQLR